MLVREQHAPPALLWLTEKKKSPLLFFDLWYKLYCKLYTYLSYIVKRPNQGRVTTFFIFIIITYSTICM